MTTPIHSSEPPKPPVRYIQVIPKSKDYKFPDRAKQGQRALSDWQAGCENAGGHHKGLNCIIPPKPVIDTAQAQIVVTGPQVPVQAPSYGGSHEDWMAAAGIAPGDYTYVNYIIMKESGWRPFAQEPNTHAYGLCQSLPASKMASMGADFMTNPVTQLKWCNQYALKRYGSWAGAYSAWLRQHWW